MSRNKLVVTLIKVLHVGNSLLARATLRKKLLETASGSGEDVVAEAEELLVLAGTVFLLMVISAAYPTFWLHFGHS